VVLLTRILPNIRRVGQNCIYTPYMTVYFVISLPKLPNIHRIYMVLANPKYTVIYGVSVQFWPTLEMTQISKGLYTKAHRIQLHITPQKHTTSPVSLDFCCGKAQAQSPHSACTKELTQMHRRINTCSGSTRKITLCARTCGTQNLHRRTGWVKIVEQIVVGYK